MSWPFVKLGDVCDLQNGYAFKSSDYVEVSNTLSCRMSNIRPGGIFDIDYNSRFLPDDFAEKYNQFLLKDDDVVIAMTDLADSPKILGVPTVIETFGRNILLNQRVGKLVIKDASRVYFPYLKLALNYPQVRSIYKKFAGGGLQINLGKSDLLSVEIPLPPLAEQQRIAAILDKADAIRRKRQQAIQLADDFLRAVFLDMFGDPVTNPKGWEVKKIADLSRQVTVGLVIKPASYYVDDGIPAIRSLNIKETGIDCRNLVYFSESDNEGPLAKSRVYTGDIVIVRSGQPGKAAVISENLNGVNAIDVLILRPDFNCLDSDYFAYFMNSGAGKNLVMSEGRGQIQQHLNVGSLSAAYMPIPELKLQKSFVETLKLLRSKFWGDKESEYIELFDSLSQKAFRGEL